MKTITIDREYGSGGREIGKKISEKTQIPYYDDELIMQAAENYGLSVGLLKEYDEKYIGSTLYNIAMIAKNMKLDSDNNKTYGIYYVISETIKRISSKGSAVFIGRCASEILQEHCSTLDVFIFNTDIPQRKKCIIEGEQALEENAEYILKKRDKQRKEFFEFFTGKKWGERKNYDLLLNTSLLDYETCADMVIRAAQYKKGM